MHTLKNVNGIQFMTHELIGKTGLFGNNLLRNLKQLDIRNRIFFYEMSKNTVMLHTALNKPLQGVALPTSLS